MKVQCNHSADQNNFTKSLQGYKIYKDQCVKCFHQPTKPEGLFICMKCFNGFCPEDRDDHLVRHKHPLFINYVMKQKKVQEKIQIKKLAIGKQGGALGGPQYQDFYKIYCAQCKAYDFQHSSAFKPQVQSLKNTQSPFKKQIAVAWEVQIHPCEHTLTLQQNPVNKDLSKCADCDLSTNLWLCLTCGNTGCGRSNWDGSGGNNHGKEHFEKTSHPLVVKLGTITAEGQASMYCYTCNDEVKDELLSSHLSVLGIEIGSQKKTQKNMTELSLEYNLNYSLSMLIEGDKTKAKIMYGPEYTGMDNIGNSCYLNSVIQTLNSLPQFKEQYFTKGMQHMKNCGRLPSNCFYCQISKISCGLNSGKYSQKKNRTQVINEEQVIQQYQEAIRPFDYKVLVAENNADFISDKQQDAEQYLQWVFDRLQKEEPKYGNNIPSLFNFTQCNKMVCTKCNGVKLIEGPTNQLKFPVPPPSQKDIENFYQSLQKITDEKVKESKLCEDPEYPLNFSQCLNILRAGESIQAKCPKCKVNTEFISHNLIKKSPKYLMLVPNRFLLENWVPKKKNALINMPEELNISEFLFKNAKVQGQLFKEEAKKQYSEDNIMMLQSMGYSRNACIRALTATKDNLQAAGNWIFQNMDKDLDAPLEEEKGGASVQVDAGAIAQIMQIGFQQIQAKISLLKNKGSVPEAIEWLMNCGGDVSPFMDLLNPKKEKEEEVVGDVHEKYNLKCVIVHLGKSVHQGHYVVYIKKNNEWVLYNDSYVTVPQTPILGKGYIYLYEAV